MTQRQSTSRINLATFALLACASGCRAGAATVSVEERSHDFIRLDPGNPKLSYVKVEVAEETDVAPQAELTGRVAFDEDHTQRVASPIDGRITKILIQLGDTVKDGQPLLELTSAQLAGLQAESAKAEQDLSVAQKAVERAGKLKVEGAISDKDAAQIEADLKKARADASRAGAQLRSLSLSSSNSNVTAALRARLTGTIVERNILVGQEVRADAVTPLVTITDLGTVWVFGDLYEQDLGLAKQGASVKVRVPAYPGEVFAGRVDHVGDVLDPMSHTVKLRCVVPNQDHRLKPEMFARVELTGPSSRRAILLPTRAILTDSQHTRVIVASEGNVFRQRIVETGPEVDGRVRVSGGLAAGDKVVTDGAIFLKREMESD
jgi:cobalt-zinc-cadmium efflux system membrane fusion protein